MFGIVGTFGNKFVLEGIEKVNIVVFFIVIILVTLLGLPGYPQEWY